MLFFLSIGQKKSSRFREENQQSMFAVNHSQLSICHPKLHLVSGQQHVLNEQSSSVNITGNSAMKTGTWGLLPSMPTWRMKR